MMKTYIAESAAAAAKPGTKIRLLSDGLSFIIPEEFGESFSVRFSDLTHFDTDGCKVLSLASAGMLNGGVDLPGNGRVYEAWRYTLQTKGTIPSTGCFPEALLVFGAAGEITHLIINAADSSAIELDGFPVVETVTTKGDALYRTLIPVFKLGQPSIDGGIVSVPIRFETQEGALINADQWVYVETTGGFALNQRVLLRSGVGVVKVNKSGVTEPFKIKVGFKYFSGVDEVNL